MHVTQLVEATPPSRLVERSLTAEHEGDVVTSITPAGPGCIVTETFTGWLPPGAGATSGTGPVAAHLQTRLETIKRLAEAGVQPQRDPRTGFLPPGSSPQPPSPVASSPILPASVILPPPHLLVPAPAYVRDPDRWAWDAALTVLPFGGDFG